MINQLRYESCSGSIDDLAHVISEDCMADCLTKSSAKSTALVKAVDTGTLPNVDKHPPFREMMQSKHKADTTQTSEADSPAPLIAWIVRNIPDSGMVLTFMGVPVRAWIEQYLTTTATDDWWND